MALPRYMRDSTGPIASALVGVAAGVSAAYFARAGAAEFDFIAIAAAMGLVAGLVYGAASGAYDRPELESRGLFDFRAVNTMPWVLAFVMAAVFIGDLDPLVRELAFVGIFGAGIGNAVGLLAWRAVRESKSRRG